MLISSSSVMYFLILITTRGVIMMASKSMGLKPKKFDISMKKLVSFSFQVSIIRKLFELKQQYLQQ